MKTMTVVGSDKGGVGKTEISIQIALAHQQEGMGIALGEVDVAQRLSATLGAGAVEVSLKTSADIAEQLRDRNTVIKMLNPIYGLAGHERSLVDLGAGVPSHFFDWIAWSDIVTMAEEDGVRFRFVGVSNPESGAMVAAYNYLGKAYALFGKSADYYLVLNDLQGSARGFAYFQGTPIWQQITRMQAEDGLTLIEIGHLQSDLAAYGQSRGKSVSYMFDIAERLYEHVSADSPVTDRELRDVSRDLGLDALVNKQERRLRLSQERKLLAGWLRETKARLAPLYTYRDENTVGLGTAAE